MFGRFNKPFIMKSKGQSTQGLKGHSRKVLGTLDRLGQKTAIRGLTSRDAQGNLYIARKIGKRMQMRVIPRIVNPTGDVYLFLSGWSDGPMEIFKHPIFGTKSDIGNTGLKYPYAFHDNGDDDNNGLKMYGQPTYAFSYYIASSENYTDFADPVLNQEGENLAPFSTAGLGYITLYAILMVAHTSETISYTPNWEFSWSPTPDSDSDGAVIDNSSLSSTTGDATEFINFNDTPAAGYNITYFQQGIYVKLNTHATGIRRTQAGIGILSFTEVPNHPDGFTDTGRTYPQELTDSLNLYLGGGPT